MNFKRYLLFGYFSQAPNGGANDLLASSNILAVIEGRVEKKKNQLIVRGEENTIAGDFVVAHIFDVALGRIVKSWTNNAKEQLGPAKVLS